MPPNGSRHTCAVLTFRSASKTKYSPCGRVITIIHGGSFGPLFGAEGMTFEFTIPATAKRTTCHRQCPHRVHERPRKAIKTSSAIHSTPDIRRHRPHGSSGPLSEMTRIYVIGGD